jgi:hypothetical protein
MFVAIILCGSVDVLTKSSSKQAQAPFDSTRRLAARRRNWPRRCDRLLSVSYLYPYKSEFLSLSTMQCCRGGSLPCSVPARAACCVRILLDLCGLGCGHHRADAPPPPPYKHFRVRKDQLYHPQATSVHCQLELAFGGSDILHCHRGTSIHSLSRGNTVLIL